MIAWTLEADTTAWTEDGGACAIIEVADDSPDGEFVRIQSWRESCEHPLIEQLKNKRLRVTVEIVEE